MTDLQKIIKAFAIFLAIIIIGSIINAILFSVNLLVNITPSESGEHFQTTTTSYTNINKIKIDTINTDIKIKEGTKLKVEIQNQKKNIRTYQEHNTLKIKEKKSWLFQRRNTANITVYIPKNIALDELNIDSGTGKIIISNIASYELDVDQGAGILQIDNSKFEKTNIDGGAGKLSLNSSTINDLDLDAGVGEIDINSHITGHSKIDCGVGNINIAIPDTEKNYSILAEKGLGNITIDDKNCPNDTIHGQGENKIEIEGGVGNINITFKKHHY